MPVKIKSIPQLFGALDHGDISWGQVEEMNQRLASNCSEVDLGCVDPETGEPSPCWIPNKEAGLTSYEPTQGYQAWKMTMHGCQVDTNGILAMIDNFNTKKDELGRDPSVAEFIWKFGKKNDSGCWFHRCHKGHLGCNNPKHGYLSTNGHNRKCSSNSCFLHSQCINCGGKHLYCQHEIKCMATRSVTCSLCMEKVDESMVSALSECSITN